MAKSHAIVEVIVYIGAFPKLPPYVALESNENAVARSSRSGFRDLAEPQAEKYITNTKTAQIHSYWTATVKVEAISKAFESCFAESVCRGLWCRRRVTGSCSDAILA